PLNQIQTLSSYGLMAGLPQTWDAPPPAPSSSAALAPPALPWPVQAPSPLLDLQPPASIAPSARFQVYSEDCEDPVTFGQSPRHATGRGRTKQEVYVQDLRDSGRFRSVSRKAAKAALAPRGRRDRTEGAPMGSSLRSQKAIFGPESLVILDPDAAHLELLDPQDADVAKLLSNVWQCQVLASVCCDLCQALLAGLSIASLLLVTLSAEELLALSAKLWPFLGGVFLILAQVGTLGSALSVTRLLWILQVSRVDEQSSGVKRRLLFAVLHAIVNTALLTLLTVLSSQVPSS
ncbi:unnamed protein product, partial [Durusdinium trenchii]